jgi:hypothetical protein
MPLEVAPQQSKPQFVERKNVAILDTIDDPDLQVTEDDLKRYVDTANRNIADTGDMPVVIVGHSDPVASELEQPPVVGYARNFRLGKLGGVNPRPAIFADLLMNRGNEVLLSRFPRRSVELFQDDDLIDSIALLGATTPRRTLGLTLSKRNSKKRFFASVTEVTEMDPEEIMAVFAASPMGQFIQSLMDQQQQLQLSSTPGEGGSLAKTPTPPPAASGAAAPPAAAPDAGKVCNDAEEGGEGDPAMMAQLAQCVGLSKPGDRVRLERDQLATKLARLERERAEDKKQLQAVATQLTRTKRERDLKQLQLEGYQFDLIEELDYVTALDDTAFMAHQKRIKDRYQRLPIGSCPISADMLAGAPAGKSLEATKERSAKALKFATEWNQKNPLKQISFKEALQKVQG